MSHLDTENQCVGPSIASFPAHQLAFGQNAIQSKPEAEAIWDDATVSIGLKPAKEKASQDFENSSPNILLYIVKPKTQRLLEENLEEIFQNIKRKRFSESVL